MLVDLDYFFAQVEEIRNPDIKGKPVVVCVYSGRTQESGAVSTANYTARKHGVKSGMPIFLAKSKLAGTDAVFLPVDNKHYEKVSDNVMAILRNYADNFEQVGIDEAYLDVSTRVHRDFSEGEKLAERIKADIRNEESLTCSIGIGPNKLIAKIAADSQKPDGLTVVRIDQVKEFLSSLPVDRLIGVGIKTKQKMLAMGISTVGDLASQDAQKLMEAFGRKLGVYYHNASLGIDEEPVQESGEPESISRITTLKENTKDLNTIVERANELCSDIHAVLSEKGLYCKSVRVIAVMANMSVRNRSKVLDAATADQSVIMMSVKELFAKLIDETQIEVRRIGVRVSNLEKQSRTQKQITSFLQ